MKNVCTKCKTKDKKHRNKIGLVYQKYCTNQKSINHSFLDKKIIFGFIIRFGPSVACGLFMDRLLIIDGQRLQNVIHSTVRIKNKVR